MAAQEALTPPATPLYEDQYLLGDSLSEYEIGSSARIEPLGQRRVAAELAYYRSENDYLGNELEQGARLLWHREMPSWGDVDAEIQLVDFDSDFLGRKATGTDALVTLRQSAMPVSEMAMLDTTVGHQRSRIRSLLHTGYRYRLPTTPMFGVSGDFVHPDMGIHFSTGDVGVYRGIAFPRFEETGGKRTTIGYDRRIGDRFELGGELASVADDNNVRDHESVLLGGRYAFPDGGQEHAARLLVDDAGKLGVWTDSRQQVGSPTLRYGVFYFDPDVVWADAPISNAQSGVYLRTDTSTFRYSLSAGYDYLDLGVGSVSFSSSETHSTFFSGTLRVRRELMVGVNAELAARSFYSGLGDQQRIWRGTAFANFGIGPGHLRLEVFASELDSRIELNQRNRDGFRAAFDWRMPERVRLTTEVRTEHDSDLRSDDRRDELAVLFRYDLLRNISLGVNGSVYTRRRDPYEEDDGIIFNANLRWAFLPSWFATASVNRNRAELDVVDLGLANDFGFSSSPDARASTNFWLTVGYARSAGRPYPVFGQGQTGRGSTGSVSGEVFFDENRDGIRQPSEQVAAGAVVVLDGRDETRTDEQGRFEFAPVRTGSHEVQVLTEELPLPWGLDDESPVRIDVRFRETARVAFALLALN